MAFLTIAPLKLGHTLVVPVEEVDHWVDLDEDLLDHLSHVARAIGRAQDLAFEPTRVALLVLGLEVPHAHIHVVPIDAEADVHFANADTSASAESLDDAAARLRGALRELGYTQVADS